MSSSGTITAAAARRVADAALASADQFGVDVAVAVVDSGGNPVAVLRADGASFMATAIALNKARTAAGLGVPTREFGQFLAGEPVLLAGLAGQPDVAIVPGGLPLAVDGELVGGIGVSGSRAGEDVPVAEAGAAALAAAAVGV